MEKRYRKKKIIGGTFTFPSVGTDKAGYNAK